MPRHAGGPSLPRTGAPGPPAPVPGAQERRDRPPRDRPRPKATRGRRWQGRVQVRMDDPELASARRWLRRIAPGAGRGARASPRPGLKTERAPRKF